MKHFSTGSARWGITLAAAVAAAALATPLAASAATSAPSTAVIARCAAPAHGSLGPGLAVWVGADDGNAAAGTIYYPLEFTNVSGHTCSLYGFPGVSAIDPAWRQLGSPAGWEKQTPHTVILGPGATAHAVLAYSNAVVGGAPGCHPVNTASELRVYPPDRRTAVHAFFDLPVCSHTGPVYMNVGPIQPGAMAIING
ncbi:MAG TPA: DUF4232 domain-containing protein [Streptosporangiaceae bacterium]|nr:DUF4232 domain-containing protein [Streptosporangiaceae bacterium]